MGIICCGLYGQAGYVSAMPKVLLSRDVERADASRPIKSDCSSSFRLKYLRISNTLPTMFLQYAAVVESADTRDLKSLDSDIVPVQVRSAAPSHSNPNRSRQIFAVGDCFGFMLFLNKK